MCYSPTLIPNPNLGRKDKLSYVVDTKAKYIPVPCGHCGECNRLRANGILQRAQLEELFGYPFFISYSYNPQSLSRYECSNGFKIPYAPISDLQRMFKRLRKTQALQRRFRYWACTELGGLKGRPHAHVLLFLERLPEDSVYTPFNLEKSVWDVMLSEWKRNYGSRRNPDYRPLLTYVSKFRNGKLNSTYECHFVTPSVADGTTQDVSFYVTKYLCKDGEWKDKVKRGLYFHLPLEEADEVWSKIKPRSISSLNFGFGIYDDINPRKTSVTARRALLSSLPSSDIVRSSIARSKASEKTAKFYDVQTGKALPLARYWYKFGDIYTLDDHKVFLSRQDRVDGMSIDERSITSKLISEKKYIDSIQDTKQSEFDLIYG